MSGSADFGGNPGNGYDTIHCAMLAGFCDLVRDFGGNPEMLFAEAGIGSYQPRGSQRITYPQFVSLLEIAAERLGCVDFGMRLAGKQAGGAFDGLLGEGMRHSRTFRDALQFVSSHSYAHSRAAWIWWRPTFSGSSTIVGHDILLEGVPQKSQAMEYILLVGNIAILEMTHGRVRARKVLFRHQALSPLRDYRRHFGCEVSFGRNADAVIYNENDLACPVAAPEETASQAAAIAIETNFSSQKPMSADVRGVILHLLGTELCTRHFVAAALKIHSRTMLRRLAGEGTTFQKVKDAIRCDRLLYYIGWTELGFTTISEKLGFSEQSVMTRNCHKWLGKSPSELRALMRSGSRHTDGTP